MFTTSNNNSNEFFLSRTTYDVNKHVQIYNILGITMSKVSKLKSFIWDYFNEGKDTEEKITRGAVVEGKATGKNQEIDPADLIVVGENTYYISPPEITENAYGATAYCSADGMKLVSFETEEKWTAIQDYLVSNTTYGANTFWTSLEYFGTNWRWSTGLYADFFAWAPNEPTNPKDGYCARMTAAEGWFDEKCDTEAAAFICEL